MTPQQRQTAELCLRGAETGAMAFPAIVSALIEAGFDGYVTELRDAVTRYYLPDGDSIVQAHAHPADPVAERFDGEALQRAIREAQTNAPGYSYRSFCAKAAAAGCAGYLVSFRGRRVLYFGRSGETHVEHFPD